MNLMNKSKVMQLFRLGTGLAALVFPVKAAADAKPVRYELTATLGKVNLSGKKTVDWAILLNGSIPAPTLEFTEGDDAEIVVHNQMQEEMSIHWHGILLPPEMDGVPYVNTPPLPAGETFTYRFKLRQHGTFWYHSHTEVQEQKGIYGAIVIHPKTETVRYDRDVVVVLSDWSDEDPEGILKNLRKDGDYYLYKKNSIRSWSGAWRAGALDNYLKNEWERMGGMDLSDVGYDAFLINGKRLSQLTDAAPGERVRLRIINAAASSYFYVALGQGPLRVIAADGTDVEPVLAKEILIGMAETYDVDFVVPSGKSTELRATAQDGTGFASGWIGKGEKVAAPDRPKPDPYATMDHAAMGHGSMDHSAMGSGGGMDHSSMPGMDHSSMPGMDHAAMGQGMDHAAMGHAGSMIQTLTVDGLKSLHSTVPAKARPTYDLKLVLGGDMSRYVWHINGKTISEDRTLVIKEGDLVRLTLENGTMMHHPMHLHGHFFRVVTGAGDRSPMKHTVDVPPHGTRTIEFEANEPGEWMLHCHNLYHMMTGMARVVKYANFTPKPEIVPFQKLDPHLHDHMYVDGRVEVATNHAQADVRVSKTWDTVELHVETRNYEEKNAVEGDLFYRRWLTNFASLVVGGTRFAEYGLKPNRGVLGAGYLLPMLVQSTLLIDHTGQVRLDLEKNFQWTSDVFTDFDVAFRQGAKTEFEVSLMYGPAWSWAAGLMATEDSVGVGAEYKF